MMKKCIVALGDARELLIYKIKKAIIQARPLLA